MAAAAAPPLPLLLLPTLCRRRRRRSPPLGVATILLSSPEFLYTFNIKVNFKSEAKHLYLKVKILTRAFGVKLRKRRQGENTEFLLQTNHLEDCLAKSLRAN